MKPKRPTKNKALQPVPRRFDSLLRELRSFITESRRQIVRAVDVAQVRTCWGVGRHIVEFEQGGAARAEYGAKFAATAGGEADRGVWKRFRCLESTLHAVVLPRVSKL